MRLSVKIKIASLVIGCSLISFNIVKGQGTNNSLAYTLEDAKADSVFFEAEKAHMLGEEEQYEKLLLQFTALKPNEATAYYELAKISIRNNKEERPKDLKTDKSVEYIKKAISLDGKNKFYKELYGNILTIQHQDEQAADVFFDLSKTEKYNEEYLSYAALLYQRSGKYKEALSILDKLISLHGYNEESLIQKQQIYLKLNDIDNAAKVMDLLIAQNPKEGKYYAWLAEIYDNNKQPAKAEEIFKKAQKIFPGNSSIDLGLAQHYRKSGDSVKYKEYIKRTITNKEIDSETQLGLLLPYLRELPDEESRKKEGLELITNLAGQHENDAQILATYADLLALNDERDKAVIQYKRAIAIDPSKFSVWQQLLLSYTDRKDGDSLVLYSEKAIRLFPNQAFVHYLNGIGKLNLKNYTGAIASINRAIDMQPDDNRQLLSEMYSSLGDIYHTTNQYKLSDSCFQKALDLDPDNATVLNNYGYYLSERGIKLEDAEKMAKKALQLRPGEATFMDTYGWILYKSGKFTEAKEYITKAIDANPQNADGTLFEHLGDVYYKLNNKEKAVENWLKAKEKGVNGQIDKKIQEKRLLE